MDVWSWTMDMDVVMHMVRYTDMVMFMDMDVVTCE